MLIDFSFETLVLNPGALGLLFNTFDNLGQEPQQVEVAAFFHTERAAFIQQRKFQQNRPRIGDIQGTIFLAW